MLNYSFQRGIQSKPQVGSSINWGHPLAYQLTGCWLLNEYAGTIAHDLAALCGGGRSDVNIISGTAPTWVGGRYGSGQNFITGGTMNYASGTQVQNGVGIPASTQMSVVALARSALADSNFRRVFSNGRTGGQDQFIIQNSTNHWAFSAHNSGTEFNDTTTPLTVGEWAMLIGTSTGPVTQLWKNGQLFQNVSGLAAITANQCISSLGCQAGGGQRFSGIVSHVYYYNRVLNPSEIQWLNEEPFAPIIPAAPVKLYSFLGVPPLKRPQAFVVT